MQWALENLSGKTVVKSSIESREIGPNVYLARKGGEKLVYAPFKNLAVCGWRSSLAKWILPFIPDCQVLSDTGVTEKPTSVLVDVTHNCSLKCVYCCVGSGKDQGKINPNHVKTVIDQLIKNAVDSEVGSIMAVLGGAGEITMAWKEVLEVIEHIKERAEKAKIAPIIYAITNGVLSENKILWLIENTTHVVLSMDGPAEIQNAHRPTKTGGESFSRVVKTAEVLHGTGAQYAIVTTVSDLNIRLAEVVKFLAQYRPALLNIQPVAELGRCHQTGWKTPDPKLFVSEFRKAMRVAEKHNILLMSVGMRIDRILTQACTAATGGGYVLTKDGYLTGCQNVLYKEDPHSDQFWYGNVHQNRVEIDEAKLKASNGLRCVRETEMCRNCFTRWHCTQHCHADRIHNDTAVSGGRQCFITRELAWDSVIERIKSFSGVHNALVKRAPDSLLRLCY